MAGKRRRTTADVDVRLVEIYEDLAHVDEEIRLLAAHRLLSEIVQEDASLGDRAQIILKRLFRGLCSSRKAARLGFSVALTEFLSQIFLNPAITTKAGLSLHDVLQTFHKETAGEGSMSGQVQK